MTKRAQIPECHSDVCSTCSDAAIEVRVLELMSDQMARVETDVGVEVVSIALVDAREGDRLLVHAKEAIAKLEA
jgi:hydrogenase maturation factor